MVIQKERNFLHSNARSIFRDLEKTACSGADPQVCGSQIPLFHRGLIGNFVNSSARL